LQAFSHFVAPLPRQLQAFNHAALTSPPHPEQCATHPIHQRLNIEVASSSLLDPDLPQSLFSARRSSLIHPC
ncbi:hypothetical protein S245_042331, partial [Arachis hypogaea]